MIRSTVFPPPPCFIVVNISLRKKPLGKIHIWTVNFKCIRLKVASQLFNNIEMYACSASWCAFALIEQIQHMITVPLWITQCTMRFIRWTPLTFANLLPSFSDLHDGQSTVFSFYVCFTYWKLHCMSVDHVRTKGRAPCCSVQYVK